MPVWGQSRTLVVGHRGASAEQPENTLAAFELAVSQGADAVELDVVRCGSGEVVVFHDDDLERLTGCPGAIRRTPLGRLRELLVEGHPIPTLDEVLEALPRSLLFNIELKSPHRHGVRLLAGAKNDGLAAEVARVIARHDAGPRVLISSFDPLQLRRLRRAAPRIPIGLLFHGDLSLPLRRGWAMGALGHAAAHPERKLLDAAAVSAFHARGRLVHAWTVNDPNEMAALVAIGVDGLITDRPGLARRVVDSATRSVDDSSQGAQAQTVS